MPLAVFLKAEEALLVPVSSLYANSRSMTQGWRLARARLKSTGRKHGKVGERT